MTHNDFRETTIRIAGVDRVIRTEIGGKVRTVKQLEAAHTKAVRVAIIEMRRENLPNLKAAAATAELAAKESPYSSLALANAKATKGFVRQAERGTLPSYGTYDVATMKKPFPKARYTGEIPEYLTEIEPGHYVTPDVVSEIPNAA
ncbi:hypothetical protein PV332_10690 [Streptomyces scabiei]|uniref:hypothetical protein n=1 Tax=Streptomyces scabiei TaxID=1930 RepID=UPI0029A701F9|nr:hypothetical protein [Streptomyces scabiei]MDX2575947.1 hypothetical protein [Streptomyces scabiei]MDX2885580.1 hypothetical protein [Streptomyces scabiei]MDX2993467.1 hypothetical protein [Streptomyces scabiei]MDX3028419.1 hypothetical protein [Streptomyces scabiei]MDX3047247.1 hypothetical protein [Streptomyces scabiei]